MMFDSIPGDPMPNLQPGQTAGDYLRKLTPGQRVRMKYVMNQLGLKSERWFVQHYVGCVKVEP